MFDSACWKYHSAFRKRAISPRTVRQTNRVDKKTNSHRKKIAPPSQRKSCVGKCNGEKEREELYRENSWGPRRRPAKKTCLQLHHNRTAPLMLLKQRVFLIPPPPQLKAEEKLIIKASVSLDRVERECLGLKKILRRTDQTRKTAFIHGE